MYDFNSFEQFYKKKLTDDAKKPARAINPEHYKPKKHWEIEAAIAEGVQGVDETAPPIFKDRFAREREYFADHAIYKENKKEQNDRIQLYYILEQFFEESR